MFTRDEFAEQVGTDFQLLLAEEEAVEISLIEVTELRDLDRFEEFSLAFLVPLSVPAEGRTFKLAHKTLGEFELFLSPFSQDENGTKFEAAFSLMKT